MRNLAVAAPKLRQQMTEDDWSATYNNELQQDSTSELYSEHAAL
jgi:hypothetical protein